MSESRNDQQPPTRRGDDYGTLFDPEAYLTAYYSCVDPEGEPVTPFTLNTLHSLFSTGKVKGSRLLDIGTGPSIFSVISASKCFDEITLTDFSEINRRALVKWWKHEDGAWDWGPIFKLLAKLEGNGGSWQENQENLRKKIKGVFHCDVHKTNPIFPNQEKDFDAVTSFLCLEASSTDVHEYEQSIKNVASLIKSKGHLILLGILNETFYDVGRERFFCLPLKKDTIVGALEKAGFEDIEWFFNDHKRIDGLADFDGSFIVMATKREDS